MATKKVLMGNDLNLAQWLDLMKSAKRDTSFEYYMFPTDAIRDEFVAKIHDYDEELVRNILKSFLDFGTLLGSDRAHLHLLLKRLKDNPQETKKQIARDPYSQRILASIKSGGKVPVHDSILWILDLLEYAPRNAINVIDAFLSANIAHLPDGRINGLGDADRIIRARYFGARTEASVLYSLNPREFEHLVEALYEDMGYRTQMTKHSYDNGRDVIATKDEPGKKEKVVISCKRIAPDKTVRPVDVREALAPVTAENATKGVVVTSGDFSSHSHRYAEGKQLELINQTELQKLLNEHLGINWSAHLSYYIASSKKRHPEEGRI